MEIHKTLINQHVNLSKSTVSEYSKWFHSLEKWQLHCSVRLPSGYAEDELRQYVSRGLIRPLSKHTRQQIIAVAAYCTKPNRHAHVLLGGTLTQLNYLADPSVRPTLDAMKRSQKNPLLFTGRDLDIRSVRDRGASRYFAKNLLIDECSAIWVFNRILLDRPHYPTDPCPF